jgi:hypothetical protein
MMLVKTKDSNKLTIIIFSYQYFKQKVKPFIDRFYKSNRNKLQTYLSYHSQNHFNFNNFLGNKLLKNYNKQFN